MNRVARIKLRIKKWHKRPCNIKAGFMGDRCTVCGACDLGGDGFEFCFPTKKDV